MPSYTILLPVFREKPSTMRALFQSMSDLEYPKQKLNGLLLLEADDGQTYDAIREIEATSPHLRPRWLKTLAIPPGEPRTKPKAMIYALLYSSGDLLTIFIVCSPSVSFRVSISNFTGVCKAATGCC